MNILTNEMERAMSPDMIRADFFEKMSIPEPNTGCWLWLGGIGSGYGIIQKRGTRRWLRAHRMSLAVKIGRQLTNDEFACHTCDQKSCVNPEHLYVGDPITNGRDCDARNRRNPRRGVLSPTAKLTEAQVIAILRDPRGYRALGDEYGVSFGAIRCIKKRRSWKHVRIDQ